MKPVALIIMEKIVFKIPIKSKKWWEFWKKSDKKKAWKKLNKK
jgi:hypothetical protein